MVHLQEHGFEVDTKHVPSFEILAEVRTGYGVPPDFAGCHTAEVEGYVVEGHVPADLIDQMLEEKPAIAGLAVPGMPEGSPGMEGPNPQPYDVMTFDREGNRGVYARR